ncbi:peptidoglycan-recognition protein LC isoform X7 [Drosophila grimshawi]|uniref:peptidoglycan-recognition protein LC isoform X7 n=1 Tax=Drosophila grimshawi TaxID=7222 RepID=UPI000C86EC6F|nr:peptidoglycan-recognition protein LC isoform X7 [Drosophila grimshawi]
MSRSAFQFCLKCRDLTNLDPIQCDGVCGRVCHRRCTGLSEQQLNIIQTIPNIGWRCDSCLEQAKNNQQLFHKLELSVRQHEKRLEILEAGLVRHDKVNESCKEPVLCPFLPHSISRKAIIITAIFVVLTIILGVILGTTTNLFGKTLNKSKLGDGDDSRLNIPINSTIDRDNIGGGLVLRFVPRAAWLAQPPQKVLPNLDLPVPMVIVLPTNSENCSFQAQCVFRVRFLQTYNIESQQLDDIAFNFLIGGDGNVYVGRGWETVGAHMIGYNTRSLSLGYIGYFRHQQPSPKQLNVTRLLLEEGVKLGKIATNYILVGAGSLEPGQTEYNAEQLYQSFSNWTHWTTVV